MNTDLDVLSQAAAWRAEGVGVALATVVRKRVACRRRFIENPDRYLRAG